MGPCGCIGHARKVCRVLVGKPEIEDYLEDWCICGRVILKWIVNKVMAGCGLV
jgi:hypothetical protein